MPNQSDQSLPDAAVDALRSLGFADLEARVYLHLLRAGPDTAYATAKAIGKPVANCYKSVEALERKGAVEVEEGEPRIVRATGPGELTSRLRKVSERRLGEAERELSRLDAAAGDDRVYQLRSAQQTVERARQLVAGAERTIVFDAFPSVAQALAPALTEAASRGVAVVGIVYEAVDAAGCELIEHTEGALVTELIEGEHLLLCADASSALLALLHRPRPDDAASGPDGRGSVWPEAGGVHQAVFTASPFVAWHLHDNLHHQLFTYAVRESLSDRPEVLDAMRAVYDRRLRRIAPVSSPGFGELLSRYGSERARELAERLTERRRGGETGVRGEAVGSGGSGETSAGDDEVGGES